MSLALLESSADLQPSARLGRRFAGPSRGGQWLAACAFLWSGLFVMVSLCAGTAADSGAGEKKPAAAGGNVADGEAKAAEVKQERQGDEKADKAKKPGDEVLKAMRRRAQSVTIFRRAARGEQPGEPQPLKVVAEPLMHYDHPEINVLNGALWVCGETGRPQAFIKTEVHIHEGDERPRVTWVTKLSSASPDLLEARWESGLRYRMSEPGLKLETIPKAPKPAATKPGRLAQMKQLARRFSALSSDFVHPPKRVLEDEMRLMPTPVHRYADPQAGIQDGTVFAFVPAATNPGLLLLLEAYQKEGEEPKWQYSLSRAQVPDMRVKLDERVVYEVPYSGYTPARLPTFMWTYEKGLLPQEKQE